MYKKTIFTRSLEIFQENTPNSTLELIKQLNLQTRNIPQPVLEFYRNDDQLTPPQQPSNLIRVGSQKKKENSLYLKTKAVNTKNKKVRSVGGSFKRKTMMLDTTTAVSISKSNKEEILKEKRRRRMKRTKNDHYFNDDLRKRKRKEKK
ncbi:hypothetical protein M0813_25815 [Anaeramoeba flamelloides]|uniref:Mitochondrial mRNA-processing protein COX24 C-terminal domain-containing protein n=1 Tax=Anaeramoeba flamelloides TaxID=1746091 RepID=A0ABQ8Y1E7_9EUKA|nr:hypothetical protein M0813_25815 [Anaeramoeba flamelloides]